MTQKRVAIIPAFNEEKTISNLVETAKKYCEVIVVNDCSNDNTLIEITGKANYVISNKENLGYEKSLAIGLQYAIKKNFEYAITLDGDGQLSPHYIPLFFSELENGYSIVIGNRNIKTRISEKIIAVIGSILWGVKDPFCGLKAYNLNHIQDKPIYTYESIGTEVLSNLIKEKAPLKNIYIETKERLDQSRFGTEKIKLNFYFLKCFSNNFKGILG